MIASYKNGKTFIIKQDYIVLYDERGINAPQDHIPSYDGGM